MWDRRLMFRSEAGMTFLLYVRFVLPAVVFLTLRPTITTVIGFWALAASKRKG